MVNALGMKAPTEIVFKYERIPKSFCNKVPKSWGIERSETGWMTGATFYGYVTNVFLPWLIRNNIKLPVLLYLDGHASHLTLQLSLFCSENGIELIALFPNATQAIQPLDRGVFRPQKTEISLYKEETDTDSLSCDNFAPLMEKAYKKISISVIKNAFRACGLYPYDSSAADYQSLIIKKTNTDTVTCASNISAAEVKQHLTFFEESLSLQKLREFKSGDLSLNNHSLFTFWNTLNDEVINCTNNSFDSSLSTLDSSGSLGTSSSNDQILVNIQNCPNSDPESVTEDEEEKKVEVGSFILAKIDLDRRNNKKSNVFYVGQIS